MSYRELKEDVATAKSELTRANLEAKRLKSELGKCRARMNSAVQEREGVNEKLCKSEERVRELETKTALLEKTLARGDIAYEERQNDIKVSAVNLFRSILDGLCSI